MVTLVASTQLAVGVGPPGVEQPFISQGQAVAVTRHYLGEKKTLSMNPDDVAGDYFSCSYARLIPYLLNAQPLQCSQAARRQLVAVVTDPQLSVAVVTPTVHLHEQSRHSVLCALVSEGG